MWIILGVILIVAMVIVAYLKNKQENRTIDRHNRLEQKKEELLEMLRNKREENEERKESEEGR
jgi:FtsZ-interacting cell division protein ZipA